MSFNIFSRKKDLDVLKLLANTPVFHDLSSKEIKQIRKILHIKTYPKDEIIFRKSDPGLGMHIILKGAVDITVKKDNKEVVTLAELGEKNFFGEVALLDESLRSANAISRDETTLIEIYRADFLDMIHTKPKTGVKMLYSLSRMITQRLRRTNDELVGLKKRLG